MGLYEPTLTTLERVKRQIDTALTIDDDQIIAFIRQASSDIAGATDRVFVPYLDAREFSIQRSPVLLVDDDLLSITSVTDAQDAQELDNIQLIERNQYPAFGLKLVNRAYWRYPLDCDTTGQITVTGWWGYNENPAKMWKRRTALDGPIDEDDEEIVVADSSGLGTLDWLKIGDEIMHILAIDVSDDPTPVHTLTVERGMMGTDAAGHLDEAEVYQYQQKHDIILAATMLAQFLYQNRDKPGTQTVQTPDGTMVISLEAPKIIHTTIRRYASTGQQHFIRR